MMSLTKNPHPQAKNFFRVQATRLATSFETLIGLVALTRPEKFPRKAMCVLVFFSQKSPKLAGRQSVKRNVTCVIFFGNDFLPAMTYHKNSVK